MQSEGGRKGGAACIRADMHVHPLDYLRANALC